MSGEYQRYGIKRTCTKMYGDDNGIIWTWPRPAHEFTTLLHGNEICKHCQYIKKEEGVEHKEPLSKKAVVEHPSSTT